MHAISFFFKQTNFYLFSFGYAGSFFFLLCGVSLVAVSRGSFLVVTDGLLIVVASLVAEHGLSRHVGFSSYGAWAH